MTTLSILFTDAVASSEALSRLGDERFTEVQDAHLGLLREAVGLHGGREVKSLGDGLMVAFTGAAEALGCAVAMQQAIEAAVRGGQDGLWLRVGISCGDVSVADDGDVTGSAVVEAARLCAAATGAQVLGTETVRVLAGSRGRHVFTSLGPVELKGLAEPVSVVEVGWSPVAEAGGLAPVPLPPRLAFESAWSFVGRAGEVERLDGLWRQVGGGVSVALLGGEPGVGKTRLARELAVRAHEEGALVLFGRVDEDLAVAYQPFAEALGHYLAGVDEQTRGRVLGLRGGVLARLVPELVEDLPEGQVEAWAIFEGLVDWLSMEAARRPVVLVLDDIHWAAKPTLQALLHLVRSDRLSRLLIVGTYRDTELGRTHPLADVLADLRSVDGVERLAIRGLNTDGVAAFVQAARGDVLDDDARELVAVLSEQTQGNPFFVGQVLRHLSESGAVQEVDGRWVRAEGTEGFVVPEGVREVVGRRVSRLSEQAGNLLTAAAVAGPEFDIAVVAEVAGQPMAEALDGFDEALAARLVLETGSPGLLRFPHALVRQTLEDELSTMRRIHLHQQIGLALEGRFGEAESAVAELAHHFAEAAALGEGERGARYAERAAVQAIGRAAPEQAVDLLARALELLPVDSDPEGLWRERLYAQLAWACWVIGDLERLGAMSRAWLALARELGDAVMLVLVAPLLADALAYSRVRTPEDYAALADALCIDTRSVDMQGRRRVTLRGTWQDLDSAGLRALLLCNLAADWSTGLSVDAIADLLPGGTPLEVVDEGCRLAEQSADPEMIDDARFLRSAVLLGSPDAESQLHDAQRAIAAGFTAFGGGWSIAQAALARLGRLDELQATTNKMLLVADQSGDRVLLGFAHIGQTMEAVLRGRFEGAQTTIDQLADVAPGEISIVLAVQTLTVALLLASGQASAARHLAESVDAIPVFGDSNLAAAVAARQGDIETARATLDAWHRSGRSHTADLSHSATLWSLTECAHLVGDRDAAAHLYDEIAPYHGQLMLSRFHFAPASAAFLLGLLAETIDDRVAATRHFTDALAFEEQSGAITLAARTRQALARIN